jgi:predicted permease
MKRAFWLGASKRSVERSIDEEIRFHIESRARDLAAGGVEPDDAMRQAQREYGDVGASSAELAAVDYRVRGRTRRFYIIDALRRDAGLALWMLRREPLFTLVVIITLGVGIGANTAIFSVVNGVLLRPLPYPDPDRVVSFTHEPPQLLTSLPEYIDYRTNLRSFESLAVFAPGEANVATVGDPERVAVANVSPEFFRVMAVAPAMGRALSADDQPGTVAVISDAMWARDFGRDRNVIGKSVQLNGRARTIIGVMPRAFAYPSAATDAWLPLPPIRPDNLGDRANHALFMVGRLRRGVTPASALAEASPYALRMMHEHADRYDPSNPPRPDIARISDRLVGATRPYLLALLGAVSFVMLIVCANIASLLLARGEGRRKELAVRNALGATRARLITQLMVEAIVLSVCGGMAGVAIAWSADRVLVAIAPASMPRLGDIGIDWKVLGYAAGVSLLAGLVFGLVPAIRASSESPAQMLRKGSRSEQRVSSPRARRSLITAEIALAVVLLTGAGMLVRSLLNLQAESLGFESANVTAAKVSPNASSYDDVRTQQLYARVLERIRSNPVVLSAAAAGAVPVQDERTPWAVLAEGQSYDKLQQAPTAVPQQVTPGYFGTLGIRIVRGRDFNDQDGTVTQPVAVVSRSLAEELWQDADPIGKQFRVGGGSVMMTVVGVVDDIRARGYSDVPEPTMYVPFAQSGVTAYVQPKTMSILIRVRDSRTGSNAAQIVRDAVRAADPSIPVSSVRTMDEVVGASVASRRFTTTLIGSFALLALSLAGLGIYGVVSYGVTMRRFEIGLRMALGAERAATLRMVIGEAAATALAGIAIGVAGAIVAARAIRSMLVGVPLIDPITLIATSIVLMIVVILASMLPAWRAVGVNPTDALRGG